MSQPIPFTSVRIKSPFWDPLIATTHHKSLPKIHAKLKSYGQWDAMKLEWTPSSPGITPDILWDSDVAKYVEAACYALYHEPDAELQATVDEAVAMIVKAQQPDGYIGVYHTVVQPEKRWSSLAHNLELYGGGHLLEAAVTRHLALGSPKDDEFLFGTMGRYVELVKKTFGEKEGQLRDYPGHQEIELALMRLYDVTGDKSLVELAKYFIEERGRTDPPREGHAWDLAARKRGDDPDTFFPYYWPRPRCYWHMQAHLPLRSQTEIVGHSVQAMYWLSAVVDVALATGEQSYLDTADLLWTNMVERKMYVTGGIGSVHLYEGFGPEYDLPNETSYAETCAAIGVMFLAQRKLKVETDAKVADVLERALYNAVLAGISLDGETFNYDNPLATVGCGHTRSEWFRVFCCPANVCRLVNSLGGYVYGVSEEEGRTCLTVHMYVGSEATVGKATWKVETELPWYGRSRFMVSDSGDEAMGLKLRIPGWAEDYEITLNGKKIKPTVVKGYASLPSRQYQASDIVEFNVTMTPKRLESHPLVHQNRNCVAIQRGPFIYALESIDQDPRVSDLRLARIDTSAPMELFDMNIADKPIIGIKTRGYVVKTPKDPSAVRNEHGAEEEDGPVELMFIPYFAWGNRGPSDMRVWIAKSLRNS